MAIGEFIALTICMLVFLSIGETYQKLLRMLKLSGNPQTVNASVLLTMKYADLNDSEKAPHSTIKPRNKASCAGPVHPVFGNESEEDMEEFIREQIRLIQYIPSKGKETLKAEDRLLARSTPNRGLTAVFGIENAFSTHNRIIAQKFKNAARVKLQQAIGLRPSPTSSDQDGDWSRLIEQIHLMLETELSRPDEVINLAELIQFLTLKISLWYLFPDRSGLENREAIKYVAKTVNILWIRSKPYKKPSNFATLAGKGWDSEHRLREHLRTLTGTDPDNSIGNPMNFILPAYETMWRAVFKGVLEVYFRDAPDRNKWQGLLLDFLKTPTRAEFKRDDTSKTLSAKDIVKEILRIYPPTRHVYRQFPGDPLGHFHKADIETCQHLPLLAQNNPEWFRPERWLEIKLRHEKEQQDRTAINKPPISLHAFEGQLGFMPFATLCPAGKGLTQGFGFKMIALLVGSVCQAFDQLNQSAKWQLDPESPSDVLPPLGQALKSSREDYLSLVYRKVIQQSEEKSETAGENVEEDTSASVDGGEHDTIAELQVD